MNTTSSASASASATRPAPFDTLGNLTAEGFKSALRTGGFAWPGGYPLYFITSDGEALSFDSARSNFRTVLGAVKANSRCGWRVVATAINWEESNLYCCHSGTHIPSAYAEDDAEDAAEDNTEDTAEDTAAAAQ